MTLAVADVSEFQRTVNWAAYGAANPAVIVRAHNSARADNYFTTNVIGARAHTQWRGFYQYLTAGADPVQAARDFQATTGPMLPGEVAILDLEAGTGDQRARRQAWLDALHDDVEWTYSGLAFARAHLAGVRVDWIAAYQLSEPSDAHALWQNTDARRFAGIANPCDGSLFNGTLAQLKTLTAGTNMEDDMLTPEAQTWIEGRLDAHDAFVLANLKATIGRDVTALRAQADPVALATAVAAAMPATGTVTQAEIEAALRTVFGSVGTTP